MYQILWFMCHHVSCGLCAIVLPCLCGSSFFSGGCLMGPIYFLLVFCKFWWVFCGFKIFSCWNFMGSTFFLVGNFMVQNVFFWVFVGLKCFLKDISRVHFIFFLLRVVLWFKNFEFKSYSFNALFQSAGSTCSVQKYEKQPS